MASITSIFNIALGKIGEERILTYEEKSTRASVCRDMYDNVKRTCLESRQWSFALSRYIINPSANKPLFGFRNKFQLPSKVIRVIKVGQDEEFREEFHWEIEDGYIYCDADIIYVKAITDKEESSFSPTFVTSVATLLASHVAPSLTSNRQLASQLMNEWVAFTDEAGALDGMQGKKEKLTARRLINARRSGNQRRY